jgi:hypothetical protein
MNKEIKPEISCASNRVRLNHPTGSQISEFSTAPERFDARYLKRSIAHQKLRLALNGFNLNAIELSMLFQA